MKRLVPPLLMMLAGAGTAAGQEASNTDAFVAAARAGSARYHDQAVAAAEGYLAVGPDAPGMGRHWVNPELLLSGVLDPARPQVLSYITVEGRPVLAGVAYAVPTHGARDAPSEPAGREAWHFHAGTVAEESFLPDHHHAGEGPGSDTRVAVLHVWVWQQNPVGMFEPDNWSLPFARLGFNQPDSAADAGRALSLATVGAPFFLAMVREVAHPDSGSLRRVAESLAAHAATVSAWAADRRGRVLDASDSAWLAREWAALWRELRSLAPSDAWSRLQ